MNLFKKLGLIYDDESSENQEIVETKSEKQTAVPETPAIEKKPLFAESVTPVIPGQVIGEVDEKVYQLLSEAIERNNLPGNDFLEFMMALQNLASMAVDENVKFNMVFTTLNTTSDKLTKEKLLSSIEHYLGVIEKEKTLFGKEMNKATTDMVTSRENRVVDINNQIQNKLELITKTQQEIAELSTTAQTLTKESEENKYKIAKKEADFTVTAGKVLAQITGYKTKIETYIS
jgi:hypothetical protein